MMFLILIFEICFVCFPISDLGIVNALRGHLIHVKYLFVSIWEQVVDKVRVAYFVICCVLSFVVVEVSYGCLSGKYCRSDLSYLLCAFVIWQALMFTYLLGHQ